jgi:hypothetical protein
MKDLAALADKYIIDSLQIDIRVNPPLIVLTSQNYAQRYIADKKTINFDLWLFSQRYHLVELETYCRSNDALIEEIKEILHDPQRGMVYMVQTKGIPLLFMSNFVAKLMHAKKERETIICPVCCHIYCS